jgi:histidine triad (HIT) family protein
MDCIFCKISSDEIQASKVYEDGEVVCFYDLAPSADYHVLIVPRKHVDSFLSLDDDALLGKMRRAAREVIDKLELRGGYRLVFNGGKYQHVPHLHWHLLGGDLKKNVRLPE